MADSTRDVCCGAHRLVASQAQYAYENTKRLSVWRVPGPVIADNWSDYGPDIMRTVEHDRRGFDAIKVLQLLRENVFVCLEIKLGGNRVAIILCEIIYAQGAPTLEVSAVSGKYMDVWLDKLLEALDTLARSQGCKSVHFEGRRGWIRALREKGFTVKSVIMERAASG